MLRTVPHSVPRVSRSCELFPDGFDLHLLHRAVPTECEDRVLDRPASEGMRALLGDGAAPSMGLLGSKDASDSFFHIISSWGCERRCGPGFRVQGSGLIVSRSGLRVWDSGFRVEHPPRVVLLGSEDASENLKSLAAIRS